MKKNILVVGVIVMVVCPAQLSFAASSAVDSTNYEQVLTKGVEAFYQTNWKRAGSIFERLKQDHPNDARAYFFSSMIPFWSYYFGDNSQEAAHTFLKRSSSAIAISKRQLDKNPHDTTMVVMLSGLYGYRSLVAASEKEYRIAVESGMTGFKYTRQLLALDANDPKALIGKGMFYYMVGSVPKGLKWVTNLAGFSGDIKKGFEVLKQVASSKSYVSNDAKMILAYLYEREKMPRKAVPYLKQLVKRYPKNIIFQYNLARILEKCDQLKQAQTVYRKVTSLDADYLSILKQKSRKRLRKI